MMDNTHHRDAAWFCVNCLNQLQALDRHGRCPLCGSNAVDVAWRYNAVKGLDQKIRPDIHGDESITVKDQLELETEEDYAWFKKYLEMTR